MQINKGRLKSIFEYTIGLGCMLCFINLLRFLEHIFTSQITAFFLLECSLLTPKHSLFLPDDRTFCLVHFRRIFFVRCITMLCCGGVIMTMSLTFKSVVHTYFHHHGFQACVWRQIYSIYANHWFHFSVFFLIIRSACYRFLIDER